MAQLFRPRHGSTCSLAETVKRGRIKVITVTPESAFRGKIDNHAEVVERYKTKVMLARQPLVP